MGKLVYPTIMTTLGALLIVAGVAAWFGISLGFTKALQGVLTVTSSSDKQFAAWSDSTHPDARPPNMTLHFYNITNVNQVLLGAKPVYQLLGPYVYTKHTQRLNAEFNEDGTEVEYTERTYYEWQKALSNGTKVDRIYNYYPFYEAAFIGLSKLTNTSITETQFAPIFAAVAFKSTFTVLAADNAGTETNPVLIAAAAAEAWLSPSAKVRTAYNFFATSGVPLSTTQARDLLLSTSAGLVQAETIASVTNFLTLAAIGTQLGAACTANPSGAQCAGVLAVFRNKYPSFADVNDLVAMAQISLIMQYFFTGTTNPSQALLGYRGLNNGGLGVGEIVGHTIEEWAFGFNDPLLGALLGKSTYKTFFFANQSVDDALETNLRMRQYTGKVDRAEIGRYIKYSNVTEVKSYPKQFIVNGTNGLVNQMGLKSDDNLLAFVSQTMRAHVLLPREDKVEVEGIKTIDYRLDPAEYAVSTDYNMKYQGVFDISSLSNGVPIMLTKGRFLHTDPALDLVNFWGQGTPNDVDDDVYVRVHQGTGRALEGALKIQLNYMVKPSTFNAYNGATYPTILGNTTLVPLLIGNQNGRITTKDAEDLKKVFKTVYSLTVGLSAGLIILGGLLLVAGGLMCSKSMKQDNSVLPSTEETQRMTKHAF